MKTKFILLLFLIGKCAFSQINYIDKIYQGKGGVEGISNINSIVLSPDGKQLYVIGDKKSIAIFEIDSITADLKYIDCISDGKNGISGLKGIYELEFSFDGKFGYCINMDNNALIVFHRDSITGKLNILQRISNNEADNSLKGVCAITVSFDGKYLYTASIRSNRIGIFQCDQTSGILTFINTTQTFLEGHPLEYIFYGYFIIGSHDYKNIYIGSYWDNAIVVFKRDSITGGLSFVQKLTDVIDITDLFRPKSMTLSNDDRFIYTFNMFGINTLTRNPSNGSLTPLNYYKFENFPGIINSYLWPCSGVISHNSRNLLVSANYDDIVFKFKLDSITGIITPDTVVHNDNNQIYSEDNYTGHRMILTSNDNKVTYVASYFENSITILDINKDSTGLRVLKEIKYGDNGISHFNEPRSLVLTRNEKFVFASSYYDKSITSFSRNDITGTLEFLDTTFAGGYYPSNSEGITKLIISDDNKNLYACTYNWYIDSKPDAIYVFSLDSSNGSITYLQCIANDDTDAYGTLAFQDISASFDNKNIYAITEHDIVKKYNRDLSTGLLTWVGNQTLDPIGAASYFDANKILISSDDKYVYFISDYAIKVYSRNLTNGDLSLLQTINCGSDISQEIYSYDGVISYDQTSLFMVNDNSPHLIEYRRDISSGLLSFYNTYAHNDSIDSPGTISISKNKKYIYIGGYYLDIGVIRLNPNNDIYEYVKTIRGNEVIEGGLKAINSLTITSDERSLYALSSDDKSITNYRPTLFLGNDINACEGDTVILSTQANYNSYLWSTNSINENIEVTSSGQYRITIINSFGEIEKDSINVIVNPLPEPDLGPDIAQCLHFDEEIALKCSKEYTRYYWNTDENLKQIMVNESGNYSVLVTDSNGCKNTDTVNVTVYEYPSIELGEDVNMCGDSYTIIPTADTVNTFLWSNSTQEDSLIVYESGIYKLFVTNKNGCESEDSISVFLKPIPVIVLNTDTSLTKVDTLLLNPGIFDSYYWHCSKYNSYEPVLLLDSSFFTGVDNIEIYLTVTQNGCYATDSINIFLNTLGLTEHLINNINVYPNPTKDNFIVKLDNDISKIINVRIYSMNGEIVYNGTYTNNIIEINMENYSTGMYLLEFKSDQLYEIIKVIKN